MDSDRERRRRRRPSQEPESDRDARRRKGHRATDSQGDLLPKTVPSSRDKGNRENGYGSSRETASRSRRESRTTSSSRPLSTRDLEALNKTRGHDRGGYDADYLEEVRSKELRLEKERRKEERDAERERRKAVRAQREESAARQSEREERARRSEAEGTERERRKRNRQDPDETIERERRREEERERRREEKRLARRAEKLAEKESARQTEMAAENAAAEERERLRYLERDKQRQLRKAQQEQARQERERPRERPRQAAIARDDYYDDDSYLSSPDRSPRKPDRRRAAAGGIAYNEVRNENSPRVRGLPSSEVGSAAIPRWKTWFAKKEPAVESPKRKSRVISGPYLEDQQDEVYAYRKDKLEGSSQASRSDYTSTTVWTKKRNKRICIYVGILLLILIIVIPVGITLSKKKDASSPSGGGGGRSASNSGSSNSNLKGLDPDSVPADKKKTIYDPWAWLDTTDFNCTYTDETVGGLPVIGLYDYKTSDDNVQANDKVPKLSDEWKYGDMPVHGINVGGWLNFEPFITPSFFEKYSSREEVVDEWTLAVKLGPLKAAAAFEQHYSTFITKQSFIDIRAAGFDHVRIPFGYWAVTTYEGDLYVSQIAWRYLLRAIEYCRQNGLRVNLDLHGAPGSQNGWTHSGRVGTIGWLNGTDGTLNGQRTIDIHDQLTKFFTQPRYKNLITMYGLINEPRMVSLDTAAVLSWSEAAIAKIRSNGYEGILIFGDGFMGLDKWQGKLQSDTKLVLDVHQYVIFNNDQIKLPHADKLTFACKGWTAQTVRSMNRATGFGPTMCGEWSQADTDCALYINDVGIGSRWEGTLNTGNASTHVLEPQCPTNNSPICSCDGANADPSTYSAEYKDWLLKFALAQMESFEYGWGWFYWTWKTEKSTQWSWQLGMSAGILPQTVYDRDWTCDDAVPDYAAGGLPEFYRV